MALILIPLMAVTFAFVDIGMCLFLWTTMQNAAREGARYGITFQTAGALGQDASIKQQVAYYSMGFVSAASTPTSGPTVPYIDVNYYDPANPAVPIPAPGGNLPGNIVEVSIRNYRWNFIAPMSGTTSGPFYATTATPLVINTYSADVLNGYPPGTGAGGITR